MSSATDGISTLLLWSLPAAISLHVFEEFAYPGGLVRWIREFKPRKTRRNFYYFCVNAAAILATSLFAVLADDRPTVFYMYLYFLALMAGNAASHLRSWIHTHRYCPGAVTGGLLLIPLFAVASWHFLRTGPVNLAAGIIFICIGTFAGWFVFGLHFQRMAAR